VDITTTCLSCHDGTVAALAIQRELQKISAHGMSLGEAPGIPGGPYLEGTRVTCADCHNPHSSGSAEGLTPGLPPSLSGIPGVALNGAQVTAVRYEHELCFRCHGDAPARVNLVVSRQILQPNIRIKFQPTNPSFHPVGNPGANINVPSLLPPFNTASTITCGDCHSSDDTRALGGTGPAGPHGSIYKPILAQRYDEMDFSMESPSSYALCYRCHQRDSLLRDDSFKHKLHVVDQQSPCSICHDPHGISSAQGTVQNQSRLINFDRSVVFPNQAAKLEYVNLGTFHGQCSLTCHGKEHIATPY
jgi:hypothetical protein